MDYLCKSKAILKLLTLSVKISVAFITSIMLVACSTKEPKCCSPELNVYKINVCINKDLSLGISIDSLLKAVPKVEAYYDEGLGEFYSKCQGDRSFHNEDMFLMGNDTVFQSNVYTFCDSVLVNAKFSFNVWSFVEEDNFYSAIFNRYSCLKKTVEEDYAFVKRIYDVGNVPVNSSKATSISIEFNVPANED